MLFNSRLKRRATTKRDEATKARKGVANLAQPRPRVRCARLSSGSWRDTRENPSPRLPPQDSGRLRSRFSPPRATGFPINSVCPWHTLLFRKTNALSKVPYTLHPFIRGDETTNYFHFADRKCLLGSFLGTNIFGAHAVAGQKYSYIHCYIAGNLFVLGSIAQKRTMVGRW